MLKFNKHLSFPRFFLSFSLFVSLFSLKTEKHMRATTLRLYCPLSAKAQTSKTGLFCLRVSEEAEGFLWCHNSNINISMRSHCCVLGSVFCVLCSAFCVLCSVFWDLFEICLRSVQTSNMNYCIMNYFLIASISSLFFLYTIRTRTQRWAMSWRIDSLDSAKETKNNEEIIIATIIINRKEKK